MRLIVTSVLCCVCILAGAAHGQNVDNHGASSPPDPHSSERFDLYRAIPHPANTWERVLFWNSAVLTANALDNTPGVPGGALRADQAGPARTSRAFAIVHLAMFDAINAVRQRYPSYAGIAPAPSGASADAAIAQAAHDTLVAMYPSQSRALGHVLARDLARLPLSRAKLDGIETGRRAAAAILALRAHDGGDEPDPIVGVNFFPDLAPGKWRPDPVSNNQVALGALWGKVHTFVLEDAKAFKPPPPPALDSAEYTQAFNEVKRLGGDGINTPTERTHLQTLIGIFWGYDGAALVGTRPRQYNQVAVAIARTRTSDALEMAHLLAMVNVAIADSCMVAWDYKWHWQFWRPVTAIREGSRNGPTGRGDGNRNTNGNPTWTPLGSPATNLPGVPNFTPPFPSYPSGHAVLGSAAFQVLRMYYGTDKLPFTYVSDELNGINRDNQGHVRPRWVRTFPTLTSAEQDNAVSRLYLGVHFRFDLTNGMAAGRNVGEYVFKHGLVQPSVMTGQ